jgi:hypothetical protein
MKISLPLPNPSPPLFPQSPSLLLLQSADFSPTLEPRWRTEGPAAGECPVGRQPRGGYAESGVGQDGGVCCAGCRVPERITEGGGVPLVSTPARSSTAAGDRDLPATVEIRASCGCGCAGTELLRPGLEEAERRFRDRAVPPPPSC